MTYKLSHVVKPELVRAALQHVKKSGEFEVRATELLGELLKSAHAIASDIETEKAKHFAGIRPQDRREQFKRMAAEIDKIANGLVVFTAPMERYLEDRTTPPMRPTGLSELRRALADQFKDTLSVEYIGRFGFEPLQFNPRSVTHGSLNSRNRSDAIDASGEYILIDLLKQIAGSLHYAERTIATATLNGPRNLPFRHILLVNIVMFWQEIHEDKGIASYGGGTTALFKFCWDLCRAIDAGRLCSETHLQIAVSYYNEKIAEKPTPQTTQISPITGWNK